MDRLDLAMPRDYWRKRRDPLRAVNAPFQREPPGSLASVVLACRLQARREARATLLVREYGLVVDASPPGVLPWFREPATAVEEVHRAECWAAWMNDTLVLADMATSVFPLPQAEQGRAALAAVQRGQARFPELTTRLLHVLEHDRARAAAALLMAGWAATHADHELNQRYAAGLEAEAQFQEVGWKAVEDDLLPALVLDAAEAMRDRRWDDRAFLRAVVGPVGSEDARGRVVSPHDGRHVSLSAEEEFLALSNAQRDQQQADQYEHSRRALWAAAKLSRREIEVMERCAQGWDPKPIAEELGIPEDQVKTHRKRARRKAQRYLANAARAAEWHIPPELLG